jgi:hypothetical protein
MATTTTDPFDRMLDDMETGPAAGPRFPLGMCILGIVLPSLGLAAAALNVRWGASASPDRTDALEASWMYVNVLLALGWLVAWPMAALRGRSRMGVPVPAAERREMLGWEVAALAIGAIPGMGVAAFLSGITPVAAIPMLFLQGCLAAAAWGAMRLATGHSQAEAVTVGALTAVAVAGPLAVYFWAEFFVAAGGGWFMAVPLMAVAHAARGSVDGGFWWVVPLWGIAGGGLGATSYALSPRS